MNLPETEDFTKFIYQVSELLEHSARAKGYNTTGANGTNDLYELVNKMNNSPGHPAGEIIYKTVRYMQKKDKKDLVKIAAWAYLIWRLDK